MKLSAVAGAGDGAGEGVETGIGERSEEELAPESEELKDAESDPEGEELLSDEADVFSEPGDAERPEGVETAGGCGGTLNSVDAEAGTDAEGEGRSHLRSPAQKLSS